MRDWPPPSDLKELRSFVGFCSYYRRFIDGFAELASPLTNLTKKSVRFRWSEDCETAFEELKLRLVSAPVLGMPNDNDKFVLDTDASDVAIGAVLSQMQDGKKRVIAYTSRRLSVRERNYCITRRELLAVVHFVKYFKAYLLGRTFDIRTDHAALQWLRRTPEPIGQQARWLEQLEEFDYTVIHRAGNKHGNADGMSRIPCDKMRCCAVEDAVHVTGTVTAVWCQTNEKKASTWADLQEADPDMR